MPIRLLKPGIRTSERFNTCSWIAQSAYVRLITLADDFGRYLGNPRLLRSELFPLAGPRGQDIPLPQVETALSELQSANLILLYERDGTSFVQITKWKERIRADKSLYPDPDDSHMTVIRRAEDGHLTVTSIEPGQPNGADVVKKHIAKIAGACLSDDSHLPASPSPSPSPSPAPSPAPSPPISLNRFDGKKKPLGSPTFVAQIANRIVSNADGWHYDNCKVPLDAFKASSLVTVIEPYAGTLAGEVIIEAWREAVYDAHGAFTDGTLPKARNNPAAYAVACFKSRLKAAPTNGPAH